MLLRFLVALLCVCSLCLTSEVLGESWLSAESNPGFNPSPGQTLSSVDFTPILFTTISKKGDSISASCDHFTFRLKKGSYLVTFTGTFQNDPPGTGLANVDLGFQVESGESTEILFLKRFFASLNTGTSLVTSSGIIRVKEHARFQVVAKTLPLFDPSGPLEVAVHNRNVSIIQLSD